MNKVMSKQIAALVRRLTISRISLCYNSTSNLLSISRPRFVPLIPVSCIHSSSQRLRKSKKNLPSEPTKFTSSPANADFISMMAHNERNEYQPLIVTVSLVIFLVYFLLLREENDVDEELNYGLFDRVPQLEEPHLIQAIPRMRDAGIDTTEAERRLKELREKRLSKETEEKA